ncbi:protein spalt-accessory-like [Drosophila busckii]|uniref:protein spalt-accessory-like n=1 Tax=Drosophila busckii TaxID=30019 RepID=UPI0014332855|nr:protein spalt-accessory-like [Drosophila busckii]
MKILIVLALVIAAASALPQFGFSPYGGGGFGGGGFGGRPGFGGGGFGGRPGFGGGLDSTVEVVALVLMAAALAVALDSTVEAAALAVAAAPHLQLHPLLLHLVVAVALI